jgi:hypothetical protein
MIWTIFVLACLALSAGRVAFDRYWQKELTLISSALYRAQIATRITRNHVRSKLSDLVGEPVAVVERELGLPAGALLAGSREGRQVVRIDEVPPLTYQDGVVRDADLTGWKISLIFYDGKFRNGTMSPPANFGVGPPRGWVLRLILNWTATGIVFVAPFVWLGGLLAARLERSRRPGASRTRFGEVALGAAILWTATLAATPDAFTRRPIQFAVGIGALGILVALRVTLKFARADHVRQSNHCGGCNYDLTGNVSGVCPECGMVTEQGARRKRAARAAAVAQAVQQLDDDAAVQPEATETTVTY